MTAAFATVAAEMNVTFRGMRCSCAESRHKTLRIVLIQLALRRR